MKTTHGVAPALALAAILAGSAAVAQETGPKVKVLSAATDATQETVLVGRSLAGDMIIKLELEPA